MISQSKDGELIARIAELSGWKTVRGSSSKNGLKALEQMNEALKINRFAAHVVDGPRGPAGIVKKGAIHLASNSGAMIVPVSISAKNAWIFNSWDRFILPKPFSKVTISYGDMREINEDGDSDTLEKHRQKLEATMHSTLV